MAETRFFGAVCPRCRRRWGEAVMLNYTTGSYAFFVMRCLGCGAHTEPYLTVEEAKARFARGYVTEVDA